MSLAEIETALRRHGLILRGGFHPEPGEPGLEWAGTVLLVGHAGPAMWEKFEPHIDGFDDPLNRWTRQVMKPVAAQFSADVVYPFGERHWPFQRWAQRAESVHPSPIGLLIHPEYGLWHAYRAALLFRQILPLTTPSAAASPCESCAEKPCLTACPAGAFTTAGYAVPACATHLRTAASVCAASGCHARNACPAGRSYRYGERQIRFHMAAFGRTVAPAGTTAQGGC